MTCERCKGKGVATSYYHSDFTTRVRPIEVTCPICHGSGKEEVEMVYHDSPGEICRICDGEGRLINDDGVMIPALGAFGPRGMKSKKCWACSGVGRIWPDEEEEDNEP